MVDSCRLFMKSYKYIKSNAFTVGHSEGNPAACIFVGGEYISDAEMQRIASEHRGFVMETVFCAHSSKAECTLSYYSSECEVDFCGHGTIATMYGYVNDNPQLRSRKVIDVETRRKGMIKVYNEIDAEDAIYIEAPKAVEYNVRPTVDEIEHILSLPNGAIDRNRSIRLIDAGLRTLIVGIRSLSDEVGVFPDLDQLKSFCVANDIDIILIYSMEVASNDSFAHTRVFAPKFGYLEDPATGSGNSAFANYLLMENMWNGEMITIEQGGNDRIYNAVKLKTLDGKVLFGGRATKKIEGVYCI